MIIAVADRLLPLPRDVAGHGRRRDARVRVHRDDPASRAPRKFAEVAAPEDLPRYLAIRGVIVKLGLAIGYALAEVQFAGGGYAVVCRIAAVLSVIAAAVLVAAGAPSRESRSGAVRALTMWL